MKERVVWLRATVAGRHLVAHRYVLIEILAIDTIAAATEYPSCEALTVQLEASRLLTVTLPRF